VDGYYLALSMSDCACCAECVGLKGNACANPKKARPAFHSVGIDVFATVHGLGLPLETLASEDEPQNWYAAVWVE
jgi:predicted metal-binding protein